MSEELFVKLKASNRLPSPPGVALRILEMARSDDASLEDMAKTISSDPALTGRILKFINSPIAAMGRRVSSLDEAVNQIGFRGVQMMALSFSLVSSGKMEACPSFDFKLFWSRSLACAVASKVFAKTSGRLDPNEAFIVGLLQSIGQLAMACGISDQYEKVLLASKDNPTELSRIEREHLGVTHIETSSRLLQDWKLPESVWQTVANHLETLPEKDADSRLLPEDILYAGNMTATLLCGVKEERTSKVDEIVTLASNLFGLDQEAWAELYDQIVEEWTAYGKLLSVEAGTDMSFRDLQDEARDQIATLSVAAEMENQGMRVQNQQLLHKSRVDGLTGVANRSCFDEQLASDLDRARRLVRTVALFLLDIDHFKKFNDTYGHQVGDRVLKAVAQTLENSVRKMDVLARYGGEEFAVIAPDCGPEDAAPMAERLRRSIEDMELEHEGQTLRVTTSVGIGFSSWPQKGKDAETLIRTADDHLYEAKKAGRNCWRSEMLSEKAA